MAKKSFVLYYDQKEVIDELDDEQAGKLFKAIYEYNVNNKIILKGSLKLVFIPFKTSFDRDMKKWEEIVEKRSKAGKKGMETRWKDNKENIANDNICYQKITSITDSVSESVNVNDNVNVSVSESEYNNSGKATLTVPTLPEIISYGSTIGAGEEYCERFYNHYEAIGWLNGSGNEIKNWKLVLNNWFKKDLDKGETKDIRKKDIDPRRILEDEEGRLYQQNYDGTRYYI